MILEVFEDEVLVGDLDLLELEPLELDRELDEDEDRDPDPDPLDPEPESLERDFLRFFLVLRERRAVGEPECPFTGLLLTRTWAIIAKTARRNANSG